MNTIVLVGRLTNDPESRPASPGVTLTTFRLAVGRNASDETDYVSVTCWNRVAEVAGEHLTAGRLVGITGRLRHHEWTDETGSRRERYDVTADSLQFLDPPKSRIAHCGEDPS